MTDEGEVKMKGLKDDLEEFIAQRCAQAAMESEEYQALLHTEHDPDELEEVYGRICYKKCLADMTELKAMLLNNKS